MKKCLWRDCQNLTDNPKFCSLSCGAKNQAIEHVNWSGHNVCLQCEKSFEVDSKTKLKKFCTRSCSGRYNNLRRPRRGTPRSNTKPRPSSSKRIKSLKRLNCLRCNKLLQDAQIQFCTQACHSQWIKESKIKSWLDGSWDARADQGLAKCIKIYLIEQAGFRCASPTCAVPGGFAEINSVTGRCPLEVDHIDGDCYNNKQENLLVVCPNCHALTPTYRALNKNGQRAYRRTK